MVFATWPRYPGAWTPTRRSLAKCSGNGTGSDPLFLLTLGSNRYDNCGEVNLQSYAKFSAMSDALNATGARIFFSYEPHLTTPIEWPKYVGNAWRTGDDIGSRFSSVFKDLATANPWATVGGTGGWNDADMLEVGNPGLSIPEQRTHFALWALIKSPLLIGADVRTLAKASLDILLNRELIAVNQDALGVQAALVKASPAPPASLVSPVPPAGRVRSVAAAPVPPVLGSRASRGSPIHGMTTCDYGEDAPPPQTWGFTPDGRISQDGHTCLLSTDPPTLGPCTRVEAKGWETGRANMTTAQIKGPDGRCLNFIGGDDGIEAPGLFFAPCGEESPICAETRCATSSLVSELWYLSRHGQLIASWTAFPVPPIAGAGPGLDWPPVQWNPPYCLASKETEHPPVAPPKPSFVHGEPNASEPLQVWSGPLSANGTVVAFVNAGGGSHAISATWAELGIDGATPDTKCAVRDLWAMKDLSPAIGSLSATVDEHDSAVYRLTCPAPQ